MNFIPSWRANDVLLPGSIVQIFVLQFLDPLPHPKGEQIVSSKFQFNEAFMLQ